MRSGRSTATIRPYGRGKREAEKKELAEQPFVSRLADENGEETGANLHSVSQVPNISCFLDVRVRFSIQRILRKTRIRRETCISSPVCCEV